MGYAKHLQDQIQSDAIAAGAVVLCPICSGYPISTGNDAARKKAIRAMPGPDAAVAMVNYIDGASSVCPSCRVPAGDE